MIRFYLARAAAVLVALASASPAGAQAQPAERGFFIGVGGGVSRVGEPRVGASHLGAVVHLRAGWRLGPQTALMLEGSMNAMGSGVRDSTLVTTESGGRFYSHFRRSLETRSLLASIELGSPSSLYVRPGIGIARQGYMVQESQGGDLILERMRWETAPSVGLAVGRKVPLPGFPLNVEGVATWSGGEDRTFPRWTTGVQIVRVFQF